MDSFFFWDWGAQLYLFVKVGFSGVGDSKIGEDDVVDIKNCVVVGTKSNQSWKPDLINHLLYIPAQLAQLALSFSVY